MNLIHTSLLLTITNGVQGGVEFTLSQACVRLFQNPIWGLNELLLNCQVDMRTPADVYNLSHKTAKNSMGGLFDVKYLPNQRNQNLIIDLDNSVYNIHRILDQSKELSAFFSLQNATLKNGVFYYNATVNITTQQRRFALIQYFNNSELLNIQTGGNIYHFNKPNQDHLFVFSSLFGLVANNSLSTINNITVTKIKNYYLRSNTSRVFATCSDSLPIFQAFPQDAGNTANFSNYDASELDTFTSDNEFVLNYIPSKKLNCTFLRDPVVGIWNRVALNILNATDNFACTNTDDQLTEAEKTRAIALYPQILQDIIFFNSTLTCPYKSEVQSIQKINETIVVCGKRKSIEVSITTHSRQCLDAHDILHRNDQYSCFGATCLKFEAAFCVGCVCTICKPDQIIVHDGTGIVCQNPRPCAAPASNKLFNICTTKCPSDMVSQNGVCLYDCTGAFYNNIGACTKCTQPGQLGDGTSCVSMCQRTMIMFENHCYQQCPRHTFKKVDIITRFVTCEPCKSNEIGFLSQNGRLIYCKPINATETKSSRCGMFMYFNTTHCVQDCPTSTIKFEITQHSIDVIFQGDPTFTIGQYVCLKGCGTSFVQANQSCINNIEIPNDSQYLKNDASLLPNTVSHSCLINLVNITQICAENCGNNKFNITRICRICTEVPFAVTCGLDGFVNETEPGYWPDAGTGLPGICKDKELCDGVNHPVSCPSTCVYCKQGLCYKYCPLGYQYNPQLFKCIKCDIYDRDTKTCVTTCATLNVTKIDLVNVSTYQGNGPLFRVDNELSNYVEIKICEIAGSDLCPNVTNDNCQFCYKGTNPFLNGSVCVPSCQTPAAPVWGYQTGADDQLTGYCEKCSSKTKRPPTQAEKDRFGITSDAPLEICSIGCNSGEIFDPIAMICKENATYPCENMSVSGGTAVCVSDCEKIGQIYDVVTRKCVDRSQCVNFVTLNGITNCITRCQTPNTYLNLTTMMCVNCVLQLNGICVNSCPYIDSLGSCIAVCNDFIIAQADGSQSCVTSCPSGFTEQNNYCICQKPAALQGGRCVQESMCQKVVLVTREGLSFQVCVADLEDELSGLFCK